MTECRRALVSGKVQRVFFRQATQRKANQLGITGWVKNLPTGQVAVLACGEPEDLETFIDWLWGGPPSARVEDVEVSEEQTPQNFTRFEIK